MKKLLRNYSAFAIIAAGLVVASCGKKDDPEPTPIDACASATFPTGLGDVKATLAVNGKTSLLSTSMTELSVYAGEEMTMNLLIEKVTTRPQFMYMYKSDCINLLGDKHQFSRDQGASKLNLRNTDTQEKVLTYTVPSGFSTFYLTFEINESGGKLSYKRIKLNISGSSSVAELTGVSLGAPNNPAPSRASLLSGKAYKACDAAANMNYIDLMFTGPSSTGTGRGKLYFASNLSRATAAQIDYDACDPVSCGDNTADKNLSTCGGKKTYFGTSDKTAWDNATVSTLNANGLTTSSSEIVEVTGNNTYYTFLTEDGKRGMIKVTSFDNNVIIGGLSNINNSTITFDVKVAR